MTDNFAHDHIAPMGPGNRHFLITLSDDTPIDPRPRAIRCHVAGTVTLVDEFGTALPYKLAVGDVLPFRFTYAKATDATLGVVLYGWE